MNVAALRALIQDLPDDTEVLVDYGGETEGLLPAMEIRVSPVARVFGTLEYFDTGTLALVIS